MLARSGSWFALTLVICSMVPGCCDGGLAELPMSVSPDEVGAGADVEILAAFEVDVFFDGRVSPYETRAIFRAPSGAEIGRLTLREPISDFVTDLKEAEGVVIDGEILDAQTLRVTLRFEEPPEDGNVAVTVIVDDGGVECSAADLGEATLRVIP